MPIITLTTDFGSHDAFVATMKAVILSNVPDARIVDICHDIPAHDIVAGSSILEDAYSYFPHGTIHVVVVDPGVGSMRAAIAMQTEHYYFVGPDNGIFSSALHRESLIEAVKLTNTAYHLPVVSATFHGRDIFAPVAAHLARGVPIEHMGEHLSTLQPLDFPLPKRDGNQLELRVLRVDRFGNLITNLKRDLYEQWNPKFAPIRIRIGTSELTKLSRTYSDAPAGQPVAFFGSSNRLEIGLNLGRASEFFNAACRTVVTVTRE